MKIYGYIGVGIFGLSAFVIGLVLLLNVRSFYKVDYQITAEQAEQKANSFLQESYGIDPDAYQTSTQMTQNNQALAFLERTLGQTSASTLIENGLPVFAYTTRAFQNQQKEEFTVQYAPNGELTSFTHRIPEDTNKESVSQDEVVQNAKQFVKSQTPYTISKEWTQITSKTDNSLPNRTDYTFVWERTDHEFRNGNTLGEATERIRVHMHGGDVGEYQYTPHLPQAWVRNYEDLQANNTTAQMIAQVAALLIFIVPMIIFFGKAIMDRTLRPHMPIITGGFVAFIVLLAQLNIFPRLLFRYPTTWPLEVFMGYIGLVAIVSALIIGGLVMLSGATGDVMQARVFSRLPSLKASFSSIRHHRVQKGLFIGSVLFGVHLLVVNLYYMIGGEYLNFWSPGAHSSVFNVTATYLPVIQAVYTGVMAAFSEEYIFRMFGISFLKRYLKYTWIAILITAVVWGFVHSSYTTIPWFVRGVEVSIIGVIMGVVYVRYGILSVITSHFMFNTFLMSIGLLVLNYTWNAIAGFALVSVPILLALSGFILSRKATVDTSF